MPAEGRDIAGFAHSITAIADIERQLAIYRDDMDRGFELRRAAHVICPSAFLARLVQGWGIPEERISVLPNPTPPVPALPPRDCAPTSRGLLSTRSLSERRGIFSRRDRQ